MTSGEVCRLRTALNTAWRLITIDRVCLRTAPYNNNVRRGQPTEPKAEEQLKTISDIATMLVVTSLKGGGS